MKTDAQAEACEAHIQYQQTLLEYVCGVHVGTDFLGTDT